MACTYVITSVLYVFYCHCRCLLFLSSLSYFSFFSCVFARVYRVHVPPKKCYSTIAVKTTIRSFMDKSNQTSICFTCRTVRSVFGIR